jgi:hypothetical protein
MSKTTKAQWDFGELFPKVPSRRFLSVTELPAKSNWLPEAQIGAFPFSGEITNFRAQNSGPNYFTLREAGASSLSGRDRPLPRNPL